MYKRQGGEPSHNPVKSAKFLVRAMVALVVALSRPAPRKKKGAPAPTTGAQGVKEGA